jgi:hypothetical protein
MGLQCLPLEMTRMKHELRWNPELQEWVWIRCGRTTDHLVREDAEAEMAFFECGLGQGGREGPNVDFADANP